jgi:hypothetical protein
MFSFFRTKKEPTAVTESVVAHARRMDLEERKAFRRETLYQSIRESFLSMEVIGSMYKFKVMPVDERHHRFIVMIDVAKSFVTGKEARTKSFAALEKLMRANTYKRFGILIEGTYWRVSESESQFEHAAQQHSRATDSATAGATDASSLQARLSQDSAATPRLAEAAKARHSYQPVSEEEVKAFMEALRDGIAPPPVRVGDQEYQSDLAPLDGGIMIGGTQYGKL